MITNYEEKIMAQILEQTAKALRQKKYTNYALLMDVIFEFPPSGENFMDYFNSQFPDILRLLVERNGEFSSASREIFQENYPNYKL